MEGGADSEEHREEDTRAPDESRPAEYGKGEQRHPSGSIWTDAFPASEPGGCGGVAWDGFSLLFASQGYLVACGGIRHSGYCEVVA